MSEQKKGRSGAATPGRSRKKRKQSRASTNPCYKSTTAARRFQARSNADALAAESAYLLERDSIPLRVKEDSPVYVQELRDIRVMVGADYEPV